ncbi:hypothetical protein [Shewanella livingstonensis]|uniref:Uncharacterized protein n=1 Tax=Shewanella livingstonensis TaxID=150120 RepID=A0A3G8LX51_9GAMM|nr:hypothetical protein [Shewanella livingstonensis]AZG73290.1 hypothetical protein EGC82_11255 [Shewanella livingstonensis]
MKLYNKTLISLLMVSLWGCGSEDKTVVDAPQPIVTETPADSKVVNEAWNYIETPYFDIKGFELRGNVGVNIGRLEDNTTKWVGTGLYLQATGDSSRDINGDGRVAFNDAALAGIVNKETGPAYTQNTQAMIDYLATNPDGLGAGTARPDIFKPGHYSPFDLLRFIVGTRADMRWEGDITSYKDSQYNTFEYKISWDANGDGLFDENDGEHFNSENWHFSIFPSIGQNRQYGNRSFETSYDRIDQFWLKREMKIRFLPFTDEMTNRRHWVWQQEQDRLAADDGKYIIPKVFHINSFTGELQVVAQNVEVHPFNLRSDVFQEGVMTEMDAWLSVAKQIDADIRFTWWATMSSGAVVEHFAMMYDQWTGPYGGWTATSPSRGELATAGDFTYTPPACNFNRDGSSPASGMDPINPAVCAKEWQTFNGTGAVNNEFTYDSRIMTYPWEYLQLVSFKFEQRNSIDVDLHKDHKIDVYIAKDELQHTTLDSLGDFDMYPTADVTGTGTLRYLPAATSETQVGNAKILDQTHFGWKIADCTECHNDKKDPLGHGGQSWPTNSADGFDYPQPNYCATCHGNNGAPEGHNRGARCFWCHNTNNESQLQKHHGDSNLAKFIPKEKNVSNQRHASTATVNELGNYQPYGDLWVPSHNNDYTLSKVFPDPYTCGTCHGYNHEPKKYNVK